MGAACGHAIRSMKLGSSLLGHVHGGNSTSTFVRNDRHVIVTVLQRSRKG